MDVHRGNGTIVPVILTTAIVFAMLMLSSCNKPFPMFAKQTQENYEVKKPLLAKKPQKKKKKKKLFITFDDGPNKGTKNVLHIVQDEQVPVSFFIVGEHVFTSVAQQQMWDSLQAAEKIELCNHSYSHAHNHYQKYYQYPDSVVHDFERTRDSLKLTNNIIRTPGRNIWRTDSLRFTDLKKSTAAADSLASAGFVVIGWDVEWEYNHKSFEVLISADQLLREIDSIFVHNDTRQADNMVLLAHDQVYATSDDSLQLRKFLQKLKQADEYELSLMSNYPGQKQSRQ